MSTVGDSLAGKVSVIAGGAQGIGAGVARRFAALGAAVAILDLQQQKSAALAAEITAAGGRALAILADITKADDLDRAFDKVQSAFGRLDHLVNSAAASRKDRQPFPANLASWDRDQDILLKSPMLAAQHALPLLRQSRGSIVNLGSVLASAIAQESASYHVAKAGLVQLTRYLAYQLGPDGIRVNAVLPGLVDRDEGPRLTDDPVNRAVADLVVPLRRAATTREIADVAAFLVSDGAAYITGQALIVDGGLELGECFHVGRIAYRLAQGEASRI
jgi:glucose 1-dehydrogenase